MLNPLSKPMPQRRAIVLVATALLAALIAWLTLTPQPPKPASPNSWDKVYHLVAFAALVFPAAWLHARSLLWVAPAALLFGGAIELIQPHVGRSRELADFLADALGVGCGVAFGVALGVGQARRSRR